MFVVKLHLLKLDVHKYGFENSYVTTLIKITAFKTLEKVNRHTKSFTPRLGCIGCSPVRHLFAVVCSPPPQPLLLGLHALTQRATSG